MPEAKQDTLTLYQKLVEVRRGLTYFKKDTKGYQYSYVAGATVLAHLRERIDDLGVLLVPSVSNVTQAKDEKNYIVSADITYTWIDADTGETLEVPFYGSGQQNDPSKAFGSMLTYSERYFLLKFFQVPTDNLDPDHFANVKQTKQTKPDRKEQRRFFAIAKEVGFADGTLASALALNLRERFKVESRADMTPEQWKEATTSLEDVEYRKNIKRNAERREAEKEAEPEFEA